MAERFLHWRLDEELMTWEQYFIFILFNFMLETGTTTTNERGYNQSFFQVVAAWNLHCFHIYFKAACEQERF
jgi:hypothetical protein